MAETTLERMETPSKWLLTVVFVLLFLLGSALVLLSPPEDWLPEFIAWTVLFLFVSVLGLLAWRDRVRHPSSARLIRSRLRIYGATLIIAGFVIPAGGLLQVFSSSVTGGFAIPALWVSGFFMIMTSFKNG